MSNLDAKYDQWKSKLLDLSKRNRLFSFRHIKRGNVQIIEPSGEEIIAWLVRHERKLTFAQQTADQPQLLPEMDSAAGTIRETNGGNISLRQDEVRTNLNDQQLATALYNIRQKARTSLEEQGVNVLYLTFGMLEWYEAENSNEVVRSPLILVPVELVRPSITKPYTVELIGEDIVLNPTLAHKMQTDFGLPLPALPDDWEMVSLEEVFSQFREAIKGQPRWSVSSEVHLGLFSFEKLVMLKDLESNAKEAKEHPLVLALAGDTSRLPSRPADLPTADELDARVSPEDTFQVLDADSSQQEAIMLAKRGISFVIQGPPGTGKSQTIANIIAECLAQDKKILFVSEKMAALEVVYKRLAESDLDEFCLEAHSHKANKAAVIAQLGHALNAALSTSTESFETELRQVADLRAKLNRYVAALHTQRTVLRCTPFQIHGQLARLEKIPNLNFSLEDVAQIDAGRLGRMREALENIASVSKVWENYETHPWRDTLLQVSSFQIQTDIQTHFTKLIDRLTELEALTTQLARIFGLKVPANLLEVKLFCEGVDQAVETPFPPKDWFEQAKWTELKKAAAEAQHAYEDCSTNLAKLQSLHAEALLAFDDLDELIKQFETSYRSIFRVFNSSYRRDMQRIRTTAVTQRGVGYSQTLATLKLAQHIKATKKWIDTHSSNHHRLFGRFFNEFDTGWHNLVSALDWASGFSSRFPNSSVPTQTVYVLCSQREMVNNARGLVSSLHAVVKRTEEEIAFLGTVFPIDARMKNDGAAIARVSFSSLKQNIHFRLDHLDDLREWIDFESAFKECGQQGLASCVKSALGAKIKNEQLLPAFLKRFYRLWLDAVYDQDPALRNFNGNQQTGLIEQFRRLDREQLRIARKRIVAHLASFRPQTTWVEAPSSEIIILRRELEKKRRHKPIRKLFAEIPKLLLALKPCLMMSPLSVSQFLSLGNFDFDVVIFDEASQICPEDAITPIMRGKQLIVAGDRHQLPPTPFFRSLGIDFDEWNDESASEVLESVLQECSVFMPTQMLKWHYRSRHEALIAFSNHHIYDDRLITFPNSHLTGEALGIEFVYVPDGIYDRGKSRKNRVEARRVVAPHSIVVIDTIV